MLAKIIITVSLRPEGPGDAGVRVEVEVSRPGLSVVAEVVPVAVSSALLLVSGVAPRVTVEVFGSVDLVGCVVSLLVFVLEPTVEGVALLEVVPPLFVPEDVPITELVVTVEGCPVEVPIFDPEVVLVGDADGPDVDPLGVPLPLVTPVPLVPVLVPVPAAPVVVPVLVTVPITVPVAVPVPAPAPVPVPVIDPAPVAVPVSVPDEVLVVVDVEDVTDLVRTNSNNKGSKLGSPSVNSTPRARELAVFVELTFQEIARDGARLILKTLSLPNVCPVAGCTMFTASGILLTWACSCPLGESESSIGNTLKKGILAAVPTVKVRSSTRFLDANFGPLFQQSGPLVRFAGSCTVNLPICLCPSLVSNRIVRLPMSGCKVLGNAKLRGLSTVAVLRTTAVAFHNSMLRKSGPKL